MAKRPTSRRLAGSHGKEEDQPNAASLPGEASEDSQSALPTPGKAKPKPNPSVTEPREGPPRTTPNASVALPTEPASTPSAPLHSRVDGLQATHDAVPAVWSVGDFILDRYEVKQVFEGVMGLVCVVHNRDWHQDVAVKCPRPDYFRSQAQKESFVRECLAWIGLGLHPHVVTCHCVRTLGGIPRVFSEYVEGGSLDDWIKSRRLYEGGCEATLERILDIAIQSAWGLHFAHKKRLIHQDVKPANVLLTPDVTAKVTDFGLAKARAVAGEEPRPEHAGETSLVPGIGVTAKAYASPEQEAGRPLTRRTDIWSWAVSVMEMFLGEVAAGACVAGGKRLHTLLENGSETDEIPGIPPQVSELLRLCLRQNADDRPPDFGEVEKKLRDIYALVVGQDYSRMPPESAESEADTLNNQGVSLSEMGMKDEAEKLFNAALTPDPRHPEATYNRGLLQWRSCRSTGEEVLASLESASISDQKTARTRYLSGLVHLERGDPENAVRSLEQIEGDSGVQVQVARVLAGARSSLSGRHKCQPIFEGHEREVHSVSICPNGRLALSGSWDHTLRLWELATAKCLRRLEVPEEHVCSVQISPDGKRAISGSLEGKLRLWDLATGRCIRRFKGIREAVNATAIGPDGHWVLSGNSDNTLQLREFSSGKCTRTFKGHAGEVLSVAISPDGQRALSGSADGTLRLWELACGKCSQCYEGHTSSVNSVAISPDGRWAVSGGWDDTLRRWELASGKCVWSYEGHAGYVHDVAISPDGQWVLSGGERTLSLWELASGRCMRSFEGGAGGALSVAITPDGRWGLSGSANGMLELWELATGTAQHHVEARLVPVPDGIAAGRVFSASVNTSARRLLDGDVAEALAAIRKARAVPGFERSSEAMAAQSRVGIHCRRKGLQGGWCLRTFEGHTSTVNSVAVSPNGLLGLSGSDDNTLRLWELASGNSLRVLRGHEANVTSVAITPNGRLGVSSSADHTLRLWELASGRCIRTFVGHEDGVTCAAISPDGDWAITGSEDETLRLWELATGRCLRILEGHRDRVTCVAIGPDGCWGLTGSKRGSRLWGLETGECLRTFTDDAGSVAISPDGRWWLCSCGHSRTHLRQLATGKLLRVFRGYENDNGGPECVAISPDGRFGLWGERDKRLRLCELATGKCMRWFDGHTDVVSSVAFSADGSRALSGSKDTDLRLWELDWEYEFPGWSDWDAGARSYVSTFLSLRTPYVVGPPEGPEPYAKFALTLARKGRPAWRERDFNRLQNALGQAGYGWLRTEGVKHELDKMAAEWTGPPQTAIGTVEREVSLSYLAARLDRVLQEVDSEQAVYLIDTGEPHAFALGSLTICGEVCGLDADPEDGCPDQVALEGKPNVRAIIPRGKRRRFLMRGDRCIAVAISVEEYRHIFGASGGDGERSAPSGRGQIREAGPSAPSVASKSVPESRTQTRTPQEQVSSVASGVSVAATEMAEPAGSGRPSSVDASQGGRDEGTTIWNVGDVIIGLYEVKGVHDGGGMGLVYRVHHRDWDEDVAVKCPRPDYFRNQAQKEGFVRECLSWIKLGLHPHIVTCHCVRTLGGIPRVFSEYVEGGSLEDWIRNRGLYDGGEEVALERILDIAIQFAWGLHFAHEKGLVHQDVKPANVLLATDGTAKVADFGLANARAAAGEGFDAELGDSILASYGGMTRAYCSPEQANQEKLTRRTDIWSWAISVMEMFIGEVAAGVGVAGGERLHNLLVNGPDTDGIPEIPPQLAGILRHCLQRKPDERPHDFHQVAEELRAVYPRILSRHYSRVAPKPAAGQADTLNNEGISLSELGLREEAEGRFEAALKKDPHHPEATYNLGLLRWRSVRMTDKELLEGLREAGTSGHNATRTRYLEGLVHLERGDQEGAVRVLKQAKDTQRISVLVERAIVVARSSLGNRGDYQRKFEGHSFFGDSISISPDGNRVLSGGGMLSMTGGNDAPAVLVLWELSTGKALRSYEGHGDAVRSVSITPDGRWGVSGSDDDALRLWELPTGKCLRTFDGHESSVTCVAVSPDGRWALSGSDDQTLRIWELATGKCLRAFSGHDSGVNSVAVTPDGHWGMSGSDDQTLRLWELATGECLRTFSGHDSGVNSVAVTPDGHWGVSGSDDQTLRLWELATGKCLRTFDGHESGVTSVAVTLDGRLAVSGGNDHTLRLWELVTGKCLRTFDGHGSGVTSVAITPDGRWAVSGSKDRTLRLWAVTMGLLQNHVEARLLTVPEAISSAKSFSAAANAAELRLKDGDVAAALEFLRRARAISGHERSSRALDVQARVGKHCRRKRLRGGWWLRTFEGHTSTVRSVAVSPNGRLGLSGSEDHTLHLWELVSGKGLRLLAGHEAAVTSVTITPDGRWGLSSSDDNTSRLWELASGKCLRTLVGHKDRVTCVAIGPDGRWAMTGSEDETLRLWELATGICLRVLEPQEGGVTCVAISPDGGWGLSVHHFGLCLWDLVRPESLRTFGDAGGYVAISPDARWWLVSNSDSETWLRERTTGKRRRFFRGSKTGTDYSEPVAISPDGRFGFWGGMDNRLRVCELATGECVRGFEGHTDAVSAVATSADGRWVLSGSRDSTLRLWELDWEYEFPGWSDWDVCARPYITNFLTLNTPYITDLPKDYGPTTEAERPLSLIRRGEAAWSEGDLNCLQTALGNAGFGWLRLEGVRRELHRMAANWKGPAPITIGIVERLVSLSYLAAHLDRVLDEIRSEQAVYLVDTDQPHAFALGPSPVCGKVRGLYDDPEYGWPDHIPIESNPDVHAFIPGRRRHPFLTRSGDCIAVAVSVEEYRDITTALEARGNEPSGREHYP